MRLHPPVRHRIRISTALLLIFCFTNCAHRPAVPDLYATQNAVEHYISSGQYDADCARVAAKATDYLKQRLKKGGKLAIVLDIDETSLSNWPAYKVNGWTYIKTGGCDLQTGPCNIAVWEQMAEAQPIRSVLALAQFAHNNGVAVFYITGRPEISREPTERNLHLAGYPVDGLFLYPTGEKFASRVEFKSHVRRQIMEQGYTIVINIGDQWSDLNGGYAERTYKIPNPVYFLP
jgi:predicted secreted acid phosphatase